ncbi:MAG: DUF1549 and DUF1553 domain-containing protein [Bryobacteraceae bacterium]|nr:DUF1549 and DUF1553 domain-containing protein [Bryobacteraceae bacterium]
MRFLPILAFTVIAAFGQPADQSEFFEKSIRPVLVGRCQGCHNAKVKTSGLDLSSAEGFSKAGGALLLQVTSHEGKLKMPPGGKLKDAELASLKAWVDMGTPWPGAVVQKVSGRQITDKDREYWAFRPVSKPAVPRVKNATWAANAVDGFVLAKLEEKGLAPAPPADRTTLLRRVTFDLTGLPPTEAEMEAFLADKSPETWTKVVDRLLASPRYGEKWGRHWLDIARYADSTGNDEDHRYPHAWRYRDYVIEAFNNDMPYDQFVREQIAGDLMPPPPGEEVNRRGIVATGFLALGAKAIAQQDKKKMLYDVYDEQVDVTSKAILGLTLACARCHDHKFDSLLTRDYYSMVGMFASTKSFKDPDTHVSQLLFTPLSPKQQVEQFDKHQRHVANLNAASDALVEEQIEAAMATPATRVADYMLAAHRVYAKGEKPDGLDPALLDKWVKYLQPRGEVRVHLEKWYAANDDNIAQVATEYQTTFTKHYNEYTESLAKWRVKFRAGLAENPATKLPDHPNFEPAKDRFFYETYVEGPLSVPKKEREKNLAPELTAKVAELRKQAADLKQAAPPEPDMACAVQEGEQVQQKVFVRGDYNSLGIDAPRMFPVVIAGLEQKPVEKGSGRLELANWMTRPDNPMTARVMANRVWYWHFGEGIVRTPDNFGKMGERPTHPELLDYLASEFVSSGWSVKKLHRSILLSNAYRMSAAAAGQSVAADPENKLFSRFPRRRLSVEEIRDAMLAIDGSLDYTTGGTLQSGTGTDGENSNGRMSLKPESNKRRLVYLPLRRANLPSLLNLFDFGDATTTSGKRTLTTVAPQALFMMNSGFVEERAKSLAGQLAKTTIDQRERVQALYRRVLNRDATASDIDGALSYVDSFAIKRSTDDAWLSLARVLMASNEFIYVD